MRMLSQGIFRKVLPIVISVKVVKCRSKEGQRDVIFVEKNMMIGHQMPERIKTL